MADLPNPNKSITYFKGLNTLRFIAAFLVVIHHSEAMKTKNGIESLGDLSLLHNGANAVTFFFVLSGFLITYILLRQKDRAGTVSIKKFYLKRLYRIWPLYFLLVFIGTIAVPLLISGFNIDYQIPYTFSQSWYYYLFFLPGLVTLHYGHHLLEPLWSIGVEELFYLIWAPLFKFVKANVRTLLLSVVVVKIVLSVIPFLMPTSPLYDYLVATHCFEAMAIGGLGSYFVFGSRREISFYSCYARPVQLIVYSILVVFMIFDSNIDNVVWRTLFDTPIVSSLLIHFIFLYLIIGVSLVDHSIIKLENRLFSYLGQISYGIYMYHTLVIAAVMLVLRRLDFQIGSIWLNVLFYAVVSALVLLVSHLSKRYFENYFLRSKP